MSRLEVLHSTRRITTTILMWCMVALGVIIITHTRVIYETFMGGIVTWLLNLIILQTVYSLLLIERHSKRGNNRKLLYTIIMIFLWLNTMMLKKNLENYNQTLGNDYYHLLKSVSDIFVSEMMSTPIIRFRTCASKVHHTISLRSTPTLL